MAELLTAFESYSRVHRQKYMALYHALRDAIIAGRLRDGERLPSSRALAESYGLSRGTVGTAYDMLAGEGYVTGGVGRGTFVSYAPIGASARSREGQAAEGQADEGQSLAGEARGALAGEGQAGEMLAGEERARGAFAGEGRSRGGAGAEAIGRNGGDGEAALPRLSAWGERMRGLAPRSRGAKGWAADFSHAETDAAAFPTAEWNRAVYAAARATAAKGSSAAEEPQGCRPLREAIARHLGRTRGIATTAERIVVVNGSMQALALLMQLLVDPGDAVVVETPGYGGIRRAVLAAGGVPVSAAVDRRGLVPAAWPGARLVVATPNRQFPTGAVLPLDRRLALLAWASERDAWIVEDDYDSEFRHAGRPVEPMKSLDREGRVAFVGTFSRTMYTGLRLGYIVLPESLLAPFAALKLLYEPHPSAVTEQLALASFMASGAYERHLRRMKRVYSRKYETLLTELRGRLAERFDVWPQDAGLHAYARWLGTPEEYAALVRACAARGVAWGDVSYDAPDDGGRVLAAVFGFSGLDDERIRYGISVIAECAAGLVGPGGQG
ncbi:PLP-dependent aminotransferase family protein [Paenibacillus sp. TRM 82003]|nr:PLP-dependent aminotransferase family protein [Paenibacillus sp. TRM 82003]